MQQFKAEELERYIATLELQLITAKASLQMINGISQLSDKMDSYCKETINSISKGKSNAKHQI